jgi:hypothetical protein
MLENKRIYRWFVVLTVFLGGVVFLISLATAASETKIQTIEQGKKIYFNRTILPDNLLYPVLAAVDRLELELAGDEEKIALRLDFAYKRREAAKALLREGKPDLAVVTLGKAHQYLLQASGQVLALDGQHELVEFVVGLDQEFAAEYEEWKFRVNDSQRAKLDVMAVEIQDMERKLNWR